ncbi:MAG: hypothetical protein QOC96_4 [Acidobacteriota bacterium]|jgi:hypothetical protein|nr:hypothetical protein [Acidobacteriota bacterium]
MNRTLIKMIIMLSFICLVSPHNCFAQAQQVSKQEAEKFDEFGDILLTEIKARLDNFAIQLQNQPNTRGFIIAYRSYRDLPGLSSRLLHPMKDYLINTRGFASNRVVTIDGGGAECLTTELWIVPIGAAPKIRSDVYARHLLDTETALKFDEYYYSMPPYDEGDEYAGSSLEAFSDALRKYPRSQAYVIAYPRYYNGSPDRPNTASTMLGEVKGVLVKNYRIAASRIKIVNGGYRRQRQVELWIVPHGVHAPIATPNAFPKKRRRSGRNI